MTAAKKKSHIYSTFPYEGAGFAEVNNISVSCTELRLEWQEMLFSEVGDHVLCRYFNFHLKGISAQPDTLPLLSISSLNELIAYLWDHYEKYLDQDILSPVFFSTHYIKQLLPSINSLSKKIGQYGLSAVLRECIFGYLISFQEKSNARYTYQDLFYFKKIVAALNQIAPNEFSESSVNMILFQHNFNHLDYLLYRQRIIRADEPSDLHARIIFLSQCKSEINSIPVYGGSSYHPGWPGLAEMLDKWFKEELCMTNEVLRQSVLIPSQVIAKKSLNLSVAHLACLLRALREIQLLPEEGMAGIFRFVATHFKTKQQENVSDKSLSKEFYSINQVTAAVVRGKLLEMAEWLNRSYFPVLVAAGVTCFLA